MTSQSSRPQEPAKPGFGNSAEQVSRRERLEALRAQREAQRSVSGRVV